MTRSRVGQFSDREAMRSIRPALATWASLLLVSACSVAPPPEPSLLTTSQGASPGATKEPSLSDDSDWGPLAAFNMQGLGMDFLPPLTGRLEIDDCVRIGDFGLVWDSANTRWVEARDVIQFRQPFTRSIVELRAGDDVALGGGDLAITPQWVSAPDPSCPESLWAVQTIDTVNGQDLHERPTPP